MFGSWFYNERIRTSVATFGSLFNEIYIVRKKSDGTVLNQMKVPLSYAPKRNFLERIAQMDAGEDLERQVAIKLPRMSFEIIAMSYDTTRQLPKMNSKMVSTTSTSGQNLYTPVPYLINFQLNIYSKSQDDSLQIVEQILPYFSPQYTLTVKPLKDFPDVKEDTPIRLDGITFTDDYEGALEARRTIVYTLDFEMKINLYKKTPDSGKIINSVDVSMFDFDNPTGLYELFSYDSSIL